MPPSLSATCPQLPSPPSPPKIKRANATTNNNPPDNRWVFRIESLPTATRIDLIEALADTEHRLAYGTSERLQLGALVGAFGAARASVAAAAV